MQAQDFVMAKTAIGKRLYNVTDAMIQSAFDNGEILRTHVLRPTWHFVVAEDIYWMLALSGKKIETSLKKRHAQLHITEKMITKSSTIMAKVLAGNVHMTREELIGEFEKKDVSCDSYQMYHMLMLAELDGAICSGVMKGKKQTYALLKERVKNHKKYSREESLALLAQRYFTSHGPATVQDFAWWSWLSLTDAKKSIALAERSLKSYRVDDITYWSSASRDQILSGDTVHLLPAFDEFVISYRNRKILLKEQENSKVISSNGIFKPIVVANGQVIGVWSRSVKRAKIIVRIELFRPMSQKIKNLIAQEVEAYGRYMNKIVEMVV